MDLFDGVELFDLLLARNVERQRLDDKTVRYIFTEILTIINKMHKAGLAHRQIGIDKIIVTTQGQIKLIDLGFGTNLMADGSGYAKTRIGSPASLSPEIMAGEPYQPQDLDIFATAVSMFQCRVDQ